MPALETVAVPERREVQERQLPIEAETELSEMKVGGQV
jgi:hypothetical protein